MRIPVNSNGFLNLKRDLVSGTPAEARGTRAEARVILVDMLVAGIDNALWGAIFILRDGKPLTTLKFKPVKSLGINIMDRAEIQDWFVQNRIDQCDRLLLEEPASQFGKTTTARSIASTHASFCTLLGVIREIGMQDVSKTIQPTGWQKHWWGTNFPCKRALATLDGQVVKIVAPLKKGCRDTYYVEHQDGTHELAALTDLKKIKKPSKIVAPRTFPDFDFINKTAVHDGLCDAALIAATAANDEWWNGISS